MLAWSKTGKFPIWAATSQTANDCFPSVSTTSVKYLCPTSFIFKIFGSSDLSDSTIGNKIVWYYIVKLRYFSQDIRRKNAMKIKYDSLKIKKLFQNPTDSLS